ncbi:MAG TPA: hypothetical protein PLR25_15340 [Planctomycetaceae bacterium]|nr:hypothetical protein [Planctomycetaceae bacterium]
MSSPEQSLSDSKWEWAQWIANCLVVLVGIPLATYFICSLSGCSEQKPPTPPPVKNDPPFGTPPVSPNAELVQTTVKRLIESGWDRDAAQCVTEANLRWLTILKETDDKQYQEHLHVLKPLGDHPGVMDVLRKHPETAGLLALVTDPEGVADTLRDEKDYAQVVSLYQRQLERSEAAELCVALTHHRDIICRLSNRGPWGLESLFQFDRGEPGSAEYAQWLNDQITARLEDPNEKRLEGFLVFVMNQGQDIRRRMRDDESFRADFPRTLWPTACRLVANSGKKGEEDFENYCADYRLWDVLALPQGESLVSRWGLMPCEMLFGEKRVSDELRSLVIEVMLKGDNNTLDVIWKYHKEPDFKHLILRTGLSPETRAAALNKVREAGPNALIKLEDFRRFNDAILAKDVGDPPSGPVTWIPLYYTLYEVPMKLIEGRQVTTVEWVIAIVDPVTLYLGPLGPDDIIKVGSKGAGEALAAKQGQVVATRLESGAVKLARSQLGEVAEKLSESELSKKALSPWAVREYWHQSQAAIQRKLAEQLAVDITGPVRVMFKVSGVGRESFKRLTRLEARLFMRRDARVLVRLDAIPGTHFVGKFFQETVESAGIGAAVESTPGQTAVEGAIKATAPVIQSADTEFRAWQENVSAWFLIHATGYIDKLPVKTLAP